MRYELRDSQGASRSVAYLAMAAAPFILVTGVVMAPHRPAAGIAAVTLLSAALAVGGAVCRWWPERVPAVCLLIAPFFAITVITGLNVATADATTGAQLFYLWPVLYAANFLGRRIVQLTLVLVSAGHAATVFPLLERHEAISDWMSLAVAMVLAAVIVTSLRRRNDALRQVLEAQALADPLTGVGNRRSFDGELARAVARAHRTGEPIALFTLDVDHFKKINDAWGHAVGDRALQLVAAALRDVAHGPQDAVARLGGDEFVVLLRTGRDGATRAVADVRAGVGRIGALPGGPPGLSIGVALLPGHASTADELAAASDAALYEAKSGGRGRTAWAGLPASRIDTGRRTPRTAIRA